MTEIDENHHHEGAEIGTGSNGHGDLDIEPVSEDSEESDGPGSQDDVSDDDDSAE